MGMPVGRMLLLLSDGNNDASDETSWALRDSPPAARGLPRLSVHGSILSRTGASNKAGAVQAGVQLCVSDAHEGLRGAIATVLGCPWQRCTVHFLRDMLGHCGKAQQPPVATAVRQLFAAEDASEARERLTGVAAALEKSAPMVARLLAAAEEEPLAFMAFPQEHWSKPRSTNPLERVNREIGRRSDVVGIYANDAALVRLAGALLIEQSDEWLVGRRYLSEESLKAVLAKAPNAETVAGVSALPAA